MIIRESDKEVAINTSLDALFAEDDNVTMVLDDSDSDGYLSEVNDLPISFIVFACH